MSEFGHRHHERRPGIKRALSNLHGGGGTWVAGDARVRVQLARALDIAGLPPYRLTHGFHSYPARMHWATASRLMDGLALHGARVLDPFCGSGTTLVEARAHGAAAVGVDLNPLAVRLSRVKTDPLDVQTRAQLVLTAAEVRCSSEARVRARQPVQAQLPKAEVGWYDPHVLKEMAGLWEEIARVPRAREREVLTLVFSSLVIKFSRQRSETDERLIRRRVRKGLVSEFFEKRTRELCAQLEELARERRGPAVEVHQGDARRLTDIVGRKVDAVVTSPPYGGTYDYAAHHARRLAWLGMDARPLEQGEVGARRHRDQPERFARQLLACLRGMRQVLTRDGIIVMLMGDGQYGERRIAADDLVASLAGEAGLRPLALASQVRPDFAGHAPRREHLMALVV